VLWALVGGLDQGEHEFFPRIPEVLEPAFHVQHAKGPRDILLDTREPGKFVVLFRDQLSARFPIPPIEPFEIQSAGAML
jgi:hypothetical protein